ncbi:MAG TPA: polymer-forming cytoskeletal protein [Candidatus Magasanikbacteria bacterium]|nr:polymer-forming cytoskeletal protein [Candidatus Magasanikbacteria bacterium]
MIFQKQNKQNTEEQEVYIEQTNRETEDNIDTVVGPSVNVEGDFSSEGNIIVKGTVNGSVHTSRVLSVEPGAKIIANVRAGSALIAGEVRGNMKVKESLELASTARILGDIEVKILSIEPGAIVFGKITMPGIEGVEIKSGRRSKKTEEQSAEQSDEYLG